MLEQRSEVKFLQYEKCKQWEIYRRIHDAYEKANFNEKKKSVYK